MQMTLLHGLYVSIALISKDLVIAEWMFTSFKLYNVCNAIWELQLMHGTPGVQGILHASVICKMIAAFTRKLVCAMCLLCRCCFGSATDICQVGRGG
jgi:hypothetical protein